MSEKLSGNCGPIRFTYTYRPRGSSCSMVSHGCTFARNMSTANGTINTPLRKKDEASMAQDKNIVAGNPVLLAHLQACAVGPPQIPLRLFPAFQQGVEL